VPDTRSKRPFRYYTQSSSFFMALLFTLLCGGAVITLSYFGYYFARGHFVHGTESIIDTEIKYIDLTGEVPSAFLNDPDRIYVFFKPDGSRPADIPKSLSLLSEGIILFDHPDRKRHFAAKIHTFESGQKILVGVDITNISENYDFMLTLSLISISLVGGVVVVSFMISIFVVRGTNEIVNTARDIMATGDLSRRIDVRWHWDDLSNMADALNLLLARIQTLMQGVRQVSDNIAHDLKTPLMRLKTHIEELDTVSPDPDIVEKLHDEADHLLSTFNALLRISRIEAEQQRAHFAPLDLGMILQDILAFYEPLAEEKNITLQTSLQALPYHGDRDLLFQAYANILDNALKFSPADSIIGIKSCLVDGKIIIEITDQGMGVPEAHLSRIFERFFRSEQCRNSTGTGLGLSLVAAVIKLHGGSIRAENTNPGLKIITIL